MPFRFERDTLNNGMDEVLSKLDALVSSGTVDLTTLEALVASIEAGGATAAKQDTLAALVATAAKQDTINASVRALGGALSTGNSSTSALGGGSAFTGAWEDVSGYESMTVAVATDKDGSYAIQFSPDGVNIDSTLTRYYRTSLINPPHRFTVTRRYARIVYTNGASAQSYFRLQTMYGNKVELNVPLGGVVSLDYDASIVRPSDYDHAVARGLWQGRESWQKWGYNLDINTAAAEVIWPNGATFGAAQILTSPSTFTFVSDSASDASAGVGARTLIVSYNDSNGLPTTGTITMNGTTPVVSAFTGYGINRVAVLTSGSTMWNVGNITVTNTTGGAQAAYIPAADGVTQQCIFFTPWGYQALINSIHFNINKISGGGSPRVTVDFFAFNVQTTRTRYRLGSRVIDTSVENTVNLNFKQPLVLNSSDVFWMRATTNTNNTGVAARFALTTNRINST